MQENTPIQPSTNPVTPKKAGFVVRGGAYFIDSLIFVVIGTIIGFLLSKSSNISEGISGWLLLLYFWLAVGIYGTTLGKKFYHLHVERTDGTKVGLGKAFLREILGKLLSTIILSLGYLWVIWDKDKQGWHDKIAKTYVIQDSPVGKGKMFLAYFVIFVGPILAIIGIILGFLLVAINPTKQFEKANQKAAQFEQKQPSQTPLGY